MQETLPSHVLKTQPRTVAVFKNGFGFFVRDGEVELNNGWCMSQQVPPASFGTLAIFSHDEEHFVDLVGSGTGELVVFDGHDRPDTESARKAYLEELAGARLELTYDKAGAENLRVSGKLLAIGAEFAVLDAEQQNVAVPLGDIKSVKVLDFPLRIHVTRNGKNATGRTRVGMAYLRQGISWVPEYTLRILDEQTAELTLRGTLINEAEDLVHTDVSFVVGVPNFAHSQYPAPILAGQVIRAMSAHTLPAQVMTQVANNAFVTNLENGRAIDVATSGDGVSPGLGSILESLPRLEGSAGTDFTVYTREDLTVRKGERAIVTLFKTTIRYTHRYRWTPPGNLRHYLAMENATDSAWTTGPALVMEGNHPLSEDLIRYTPRGATGEIIVTSAINVLGNREETELEREFKHHTIHSSRFLDRVVIRGTLTVKNFEERAVTIYIDNPVPGRPLTVSDDGSMHQNTEQLQLHQLSGSVRWELTLEPGEQKKLRYTYERFVPTS